MDILSLIKMYNEVLEEVSTNADIRTGQSVFNHVYKYFPDEANIQRGTKTDCFYSDKSISSFLLACFENDMMTPGFLLHAEQFITKLLSLRPV
jgi:hypothetical protein